MATDWGHDDPVVTAPVDDWGKGDAVVGAESPYSASAIARQRQELVQSVAGLAARRADEAEPHYRLGIKPYGADDPIFSVPIPAELATFGAEAAKSVIPTGAGLAAASAVTPYAEVAGTALRAVPGVGRMAAPLVQYGAPLIAGGAASLLSRFGEDKTLPQILPEDAARSYELTGRLAAESPTAAMLGQFVGAGPFFRPGLPLNMSGGARIAVPAISGAIGGGIEGANQIANGDLDVGRLATATLGSALLNRETRLGQRLAPNLILPNAHTNLVPEELAAVGSAMREPLPDMGLPPPTMTAPTELSAVQGARESVAVPPQATDATQAAEAQARLENLGRRMMGVTDPAQKLQILDQEIKIASDNLSVAEQRAGLDYKLELKRQIDTQKALEDAARQEQKMTAETQSAQADATKAAQIAAEPPKSAQILQESAAPKSIANIATEIGTQTSPFALQGQLNELTKAPAPAATPEPVSPRAAGIGIQEIFQNRELPGDAIERILQSKNTRESIRNYIENKPAGRSLVDGLNGDELDAWLVDTTQKIDRLKERVNIGPRDATVSTGDGIPTVKEKTMLADQKKLVDEYLAGQKRAEDAKNRDLNKAKSDEEATAIGIDAAFGGSREYKPAFKADDGRIFTGDVHFDPTRTEESAVTIAQNAGAKKGVSGYVTEDGKFLTLMDVGKREIEKKTAESKRLLEEAKSKVDDLVSPKQSTQELRLNNADLGLKPLNEMTRAEKRAELDAAGITEYNGKPIDQANPAEISNAVGKLRRGQLERGAISATAIGGIGGSGAGAVGGFVLTDKEPGESEEEYQARRLRNAAIGAGIGAAAGAGLGALQRGAQESVASNRAPMSPKVELPEGNVRETAAKIIENRQYPERLRKTLADDPDILYDKFALSDLADRVSGASIEELQRMQASSNVRERLGAVAELANRYSLSPDPKLQEQGAALYSELAQNLTNPAQMLGLGKLVKTPQGYVTAINETLKNVGRELSKPQADALNKLAIESIKSEQELARASRIAEEDFSTENESAYRAAQRANGSAKKNLDDFVHQVAPEGWDDLLSKTIQGNLLTPLSLVANVFGNTVYQPVRRTSSAIASALDEIYSASTGRARTMDRLNPVPSMGELRAAGEGIKVAAKELLTGPGVDSYIKSEVQRGFRPMRSLAQAFSGENLAVRPDGTVSLNDRAKKLYEGLAGIAPEAMFRFLNLGDKPFRRAAEAEILLEQAKLRNLKGRDLEKFIEFPDKSTQDLLNTEGLRAIMAQENKGVTKLNQFLDNGVAEMLRLDSIPAAKGAIKVFNRIVVPFRQFPVNYVLTALNFAAPELAFSKAIYYGSKGDRRKSLQNIGEGALGVMMYGGANYLWNKGLISEPTDKDAKSRSTQYEQMGPQRINVSGLGRALEGGDAKYKLGDLTMDWGRLGIPSATFYVYTREASQGRKDTARTGENHKASYSPATFVADRISSFPGMASFSLDQSWLSGTASFLEALKNPDPDGQEMQNWTSNAFRAASSVAVPNTVEALARARYEYIPELKGDNLTETLKNTWKFKTMQLPEGDRAILKRDLWGQPISRTQPGENPYINQFVDVTRAERKQADPFKQSLINIYQQTESPDVYPSIPTRNLSLEGITVKLEPKDYEDLQRLTGAYRRQLAEAVIANPAIASKDLLPEAKIMALQKAYSQGAEVGRAAFLQQPGVLKKYFPDLVGAPIPENSRTVARNPEARARLKLTQPGKPAAAADWGTEDAVVGP